MINYNSNINVIVAATLEKVQALKNNPDPILRTVALAVLPEMKHRVHVEGKDSSGGQIGTYSPGYMVIRTGNYKNAGRVTKGKNVGKLKNAGTNTKTGAVRPKYNRTPDTKVVLSLTREMENDMSVVPSGNGYGIGYLNPDNLKKAKYCEETYNKKILTKLTTGERELAKNTAEEFLPEYLKAI